MCMQNVKDDESSFDTSDRLALKRVQPVIRIVTPAGLDELLKQRGAAALTTGKLAEIQNQYLPTPNQGHL